jgi:Concanavalin A-like lectin/glucanases superfamily
MTFNIIKPSRALHAPITGGGGGIMTVLASSWPTTNLIDRWWMDNSHVNGSPQLLDDIGALTSNTYGAGITSTSFSPSGVTPTYSTARAFDGATIALLPNPVGITFDGANAFSWASWVYLTDNSVTEAGNRVTFFAQFITTANFIRVFNDTAIGNGTFAVSVATSAAGAAAPVGSIPNTTWTHCCFTFDGSSTTKIYINGASVSTSAETSAGGGSVEQLIGGLSNTGPTGCIAGRMYGMGLWTRALSSTEVASLYNAG